MVKEYTFDISTDNPHYLAQNIYLDLLYRWIEEGHAVPLKVSSGGELEVGDEYKHRMRENILGALVEDDINIYITGWENFNSEVSDNIMLLARRCSFGDSNNLDLIVRYIKKMFAPALIYWKFNIKDDCHYREQPKEQRDKIVGEIEKLMKIFHRLALEPESEKTIEELLEICTTKSQRAVGQKAKGILSRVKQMFFSCCSLTRGKTVPTVLSDSYRSYEEVDLDISPVTSDSSR